MYRTDRKESNGRLAQTVTQNNEFEVNSMKIDRLLREYGIYAVLIILMAFFTVTANSFLTVKNLLLVARQVSMVTIASVGMMMVLLTGGIDLSIGSLVSLVNIVAAHMMVYEGWHPLIACIICLCMSVICGIVQGLLITKVKIAPFISSLGLMKIMSGFAFIISKALPISGFPAGFKMLGQGMIGAVPVAVFIMAGALVVGFILLEKVYFGRYFYAIGSNIDAAKLSGINTDATVILAYVMSAVFACIAGFVMLSRLNVGLPNNGDSFEFDVITAAVLGGVSTAGGSGKLSGVIAGAFIVGIVKNGLVLLGVNDYVQTVILGVVLLLAVCFDCIQKNRAATKK